MTRTIRTPKKREQFLNALSEGLSVAAACQNTGIGRQSAYDWRNNDEDFALAWDDALEEGSDVLEDVALERAKDSSDRLLMFLLKARRPKKYSDRLLAEHSGEDLAPKNITITFVDAKDGRPANGTD